MPLNQPVERWSSDDEGYDSDVHDMSYAAYVAQRALPVVGVPIVLGAHDSVGAAPLSCDECEPEECEEPGFPARLLTSGEAPEWKANDKPGKAPYVSNVKGVTWEKRVNKWCVKHPGPDGKWKRLGYYTTHEAACAARRAVVDGQRVPSTLEMVDGQLCVSHCMQPTCKRTRVVVTEFAPDVFKNKKKFAKYSAALATLAHAPTQQALADVEALRRKNCLRCRNTAYKSKREGEHSEDAQCRRLIAELKAHWAANGGCHVCGTTDVDVLSGDHEGRQGKDAHRQALDAAWWAYHGGVAALRAHYLGKGTSVRCLCHFCHFLADSHNLHTGADVTTLEEGSKAKRGRQYKLVKMEHVNREKRRRGACQHPRCCDPRTQRPRVVVASTEHVRGTEHAFHMAHKDEVDKDFTIAKMVNNRQSPKTAMPKLDAEMAKCNLYCANCHHKYDTLPRLKEGQELLDALLARGAPVLDLEAEVARLRSLLAAQGVEA